MPAIAVDHAKDAIQRATIDGQVAAAGYTSTGRPTSLSFPLESAILIVERAAQLEWVVGDADGYHLHLLTPGGRRYRMAAIHPHASDENRP